MLWGKNFANQQNTLIVEILEKENYDKINNYVALRVKKLAFGNHLPPSFNFCALKFQVTWDKKCCLLKIN